MLRDTISRHRKKWKLFGFWINPKNQCNVRWFVFLHFRWEQKNINSEQSHGSLKQLQLLIRFRANESETSNKYFKNFFLFVNLHKNFICGAEIMKIASRRLSDKKCDFFTNTARFHKYSEILIWNQRRGKFLCEKQKQLHVVMGWNGTWWNSDLAVRLLNVQQTTNYSSRTLFGCSQS